MRYFFKYLLLAILNILLFFGVSQSVFADSEDSIVISATVPPHVSDFKFDFIPFKKSAALAEQNVLTYQITYGAKESAGMSTNIIIVADWSNKEDTSGVEYIKNSASNAYGDTKPVVNLKNHTIIWTIKNFPPGTINQSVLFKIRVNNYNPRTDTFVIIAKMSNQYIKMPNLGIANLSDISFLTYPETKIVNVDENLYNHLLTFL